MKTINPVTPVAIALLGILFTVIIFNRTSQPRPRENVIAVPENGTNGTEQQPVRIVKPASPGDSDTGLFLPAATQLMTNYSPAQIQIAAEYAYERWSRKVHYAEEFVDLDKHESMTLSATNLTQNDRDHISRNIEHVRTAKRLVHAEEWKQFEEISYEWLAKKGITDNKLILELNKLADSPSDH